MLILVKPSAWSRRYDDGRCFLPHRLGVVDVEVAGQLSVASMVTRISSGVMSDGESPNEPYFVKIVSMACGS